MTPRKTKIQKSKKNIKIKDYWEGKISQYKKEKRPLITPGKQKRKDKRQAAYGIIKKEKH